MVDTTTLAFIMYEDGFGIGINENTTGSTDTNLPTVNDVRLGIMYGDELIGNLYLPDESQVTLGTGYGASGNEFTGEFYTRDRVLSKPLLEFTGTNEDKLAEFTISNADEETINQLLICPANSNEWSESLSIIGNGTLLVPASPGNYWAQIHSSTDDGESYSAPVFFNIVTEITDNMSELRLLLRNAMLANNNLTGILGSYNGIFYRQHPYDAMRPWICFELSDNSPSNKGGSEFTLNLNVQAKDMAALQILKQEAENSLKSLPLQGEYWSVRRITNNGKSIAKQEKSGQWEQQITFTLHAHTADTTVHLSDSNGNSCMLPGCSRETKSSLQRLQSVSRSSGGTRIIKDHGYSETTIEYAAYSLLPTEYESLQLFYDNMKGAADMFSINTESSPAINVSFTDKAIDTVKNNDGTIDLSFELLSK